MNSYGSIHVKLFMLRCLNNLYLHFHHCAGPLCVLLQQPPSTSASVAVEKNGSNLIITMRVKERPHIYQSNFSIMV